MRPALVLASMFFLTSAAHAEVFGGRNGFVHFCLTRAVVCSAEEADLHVSANGAWAQAGLRRSSRGAAYQRLEVTALNEPYDVKDPSGGAWRMLIRSAGRGLQVELVRARPQEPAPLQVFRAVSVTILQAPAEPTFSQLTLFPDGRYQFGGAHGRYQRDEFGVTLDGVPGQQWGKAAYTIHGDGLVLRFNRGPLEYEVRYQLLVPAVS